MTTVTEKEATSTAPITKSSTMSRLSFKEKYSGKRSGFKNMLARSRKRWPHLSAMGAPASVPTAPPKRNTDHELRRVYGVALHVVR